MYLKCHRRIKDGKEHRYWSIAEKRRCAGGRVVDRHVLYLAEINDSQQAPWLHCIEAFEGDGQRQTRLALFPADRALPAHAADVGVQVRLSEFTLEHPRQWGACWVFCQLWEELQLDRFWQDQLAPSREGTSWYHVLMVLAAYRLLEPGSEWPACTGHGRQAAAPRMVPAQRHGGSAGRGRCPGREGYTVSVPGQVAGPQGRALHVPDRPLAGPVRRDLRRAAGPI